MSGLTTLASPIDAAWLTQGVNPAFTDHSAVYIATDCYAGGTSARHHYWTSDDTGFGMSRVFSDSTPFVLSSDQSPPSLPASSGTGNPSAAGSGGNDDGHGGSRKTGHRLIEDILGRESRLNPHQKLVHITFALARGEITREQLQVYVRDRLTTRIPGLDLVRYELCPDLRTTEELIERALREASEGKLSDETIGEMRERNQLPPHDEDAVHSALVPTELHSVGAVMKTLMDRFMDLCEPVAEEIPDILPTTAEGHIHAFEEENEENQDAYYRRLEDRPSIIAVMAAVDRSFAVQFFHSIAFYPITLEVPSDPLSRWSIGMDAMYHQSSSSDYVQKRADKTTMELRRAAVDAIIQMGGRQLIDLLYVLMDHALQLDGKHKVIKADMGEGRRFEAIGEALIASITKGEATASEIQEIADRIVARAVEMHELRTAREQEHSRQPSKDYSFYTLGEMGLFMIAPLSINIAQHFEDDDVENDEWKVNSLISLIEGLSHTIERLSEGRDTIIPRRDHLKTLLRVSFAILDHAPRFHSQTTDIRTNMKRKAEGIIYHLMQHLAPQMIQVLDENSELNAAFEAWMHRQF